MGVHLRKKDIANGKQSLYLDFYPAIKLSNGKYTRREFLNRYIFKTPKNIEQKNHNKENIIFAEGVKNKREKEILSEQNGIYNTHNKKRDFLAFFQSLCENRLESDGNYGNWLSALKHLRNFTDNKCKMGDLTEDFCNKFKYYLLNTNKLNSVKNLKVSQNSALSYFNKFRCAVNEAFYANLINENPLRNIKGIKEKETIREFLTEEELQRLSQTECELVLLKKVALFAALTGLRWSDIKKLTWGDIQKTGNDFFLHIIQKKPGVVIIHPINKTAVNLLGKFGEKSERIFEELKYSNDNNRKLKSWVLKAGINKNITLHNFRHTYATLLHSKGVDIFTISKMLGHTNIKSTARTYTKVLSQTKIEAANLIDIAI